MVQRAVQIVDEHGALEVESLRHRLGNADLLLERRVPRVPITGMGLPRIHEEELDVVVGELLGHRFERRRRLRAVRSGIRAELYDGHPFLEVVVQLDAAPAPRVHELAGWRFGPNARPLGKAEEVRHICAEREAQVVVGTHEES